MFALFRRFSVLCSMFGLFAIVSKTISINSLFYIFKEIDQSNQRIRDTNFSISLTQKGELEHLLNQESPLYWSDLLPGKMYHIVSTKFFNSWRKFLNHPNTSDMPDSIQNSSILCESHQLFLFPPATNRYVGFDQKYLVFIALCHLLISVVIAMFSWPKKNSMLLAPIIIVRMTLSLWRLIITLKPIQVGRKQLSYFAWFFNIWHFRFLPEMFQEFRRGRKTETLHLFKRVHLHSQSCLYWWRLRQFRQRGWFKIYACF